MDFLKTQLEKAKTKQRTAKKKYMNFQKECKQVFLLEREVDHAMDYLLDKMKHHGSMHVRVVLRESQKALSAQLSETKIASPHYENYLQQLEKEMTTAKATVVQVREAVKRYRKTGILSTTHINKSPQEGPMARYWDGDCTIKVQTSGWHSVFPIESRCGWRRCLEEKSDRAQLTCRHLVARFFLELSDQQLEEEAQR